MPPGLPGGFFVLGGFYPGSDFNKRTLGVNGRMAAKGYRPYTHASLREPQCLLVLMTPRSAKLV